MWQGDWSDSTGRRCRRILGESRRDAERALSRIIRERDLEILGVQTTVGLELPLATVLDAYTASLRRRASAGSIRDAEVYSAKLLAGLRVRAVRELTKSAVIAYRERRVRSGLSHRSANAEVGVLKAALNYAVHSGELTASPLAGLRGLPVTEEFRRRIARALHDVEIARLLFAAADFDRQRPGTVPIAPLVHALIATGARWGEIAQVRWSDLDWSRCRLTLRAETTKTRTARTIPVDPDLAWALRAMRAEQTRVLGREPERDSVIFLAPKGEPWSRRSPAFGRYLERLFELAKIPKRDAAGRVVHVHALRHTFATRLARAGVPVQVAQKLTGHKSVRLLLEVYTHLDLHDAEVAIRGLPRLPGVGNVEQA